MSVKAAEMYQGSDWLTYRWSVAQAFDTLDRIRDLCLQMPVAAGNPPLTPGQPRYDVPDEEITDMFGYIVELCDDLAGEIDTVHADLAAVIQANVIQRWTAFEMWLHLKSMRVSALREAEAGTPSHGLPDTITGLVTRIKVLLKQIDQ